MTESLHLLDLSITRESSGISKTKLSPPEFPSVNIAPSTSRDRVRISNLEQVYYYAMENALSKEAAMAHKAFMAALLSAADPESGGKNSLGFLRQGGILEQHRICRSAWFDGPEYFNEASQLGPLQQTTLQHGPLQQSASIFQVSPLAIEQATSSVVNQTTVQHGRLQQSAFPLPDSASVLHQPKVAAQHPVLQSLASQQKTMPLPSPSDPVHTSKKRHYYTEEEKKVWAVLEFGTTMKTWDKTITFGKCFDNPPFQNDLRALSRNLQSQTRFIKDTAFVQGLISTRAFSLAEMQFIKRIIGFVPNGQLNSIGQFYEHQPLPSAISNAANNPSPAASITFAAAAHKNIRFSSGELRANTILHLVVPTGTTSLREELSRGFLRIYPSRFDTGPRRLADRLRNKFREQQTRPLALELEKMGEAKAVQDLDGAELKERIKLFIEITGVVRGAGLDRDNEKWEAMKQGFEGLEELTWGEGLWGLWLEVKNEMYAGAQGLPDRF
jgi:hypothetical protein